MGNRKFDSKKIAFFITYKPDSHLKDTLANMEEVFERNNYQFIVVQNLDEIPNGDESGVVYRVNTGFDLGAYRDVVRCISESTHEIVLFNDSIYWDLLLLDRVLARLSSLREGTYFLTDSYDPIFHYQTYFMCNKGKNAIRDAKNWLETIRNWNHKTAAIEFGELRNAKHFKGSVHALYPYLELIKFAELQNQKADLNVFTKERLEFCLRNVREGIPLNPTHHFCLELLQLGFPGIKRDLVRLNPSGIPDLETITNAVERNIPQDIILLNGAKLKQKSKVIYYARHTLRL